MVDNLDRQLTDLGIDTSTLLIDHLGYQTDSRDDYADKLKIAEQAGSLVRESIVGGRRVAIIKLYEPLHLKEQDINAIEVIEPKEGQQVDSAWEHAEYLAPQSLEDFVASYPELDWDTSALNREEYPMLILKLEGGVRAKFPRRAILND